MDLPRLVAFLTVASTIWLSLHAYVGWRVVGPLRLTGRRRAFAWLAVFAHAPIAVAGFLSMPRVTEPWADLVQRVGFTDLGLFGAFVAWLLARDLLVLVVRAADRLAGGGLDLADPTRRAVLLNTTNAAVATITAGLAVPAYRAAGGLAEVEEVEIPVPGLPTALHGFRVAQISDLHVGPTVRREHIAAIVDAVNALEPDLVALTGDLVDGPVDRLAPHVAPLTGLRSRHGTYFCTGNHEYYSGVHTWLDHLRELGMKVLVDEHTAVEHDGARIVVAGVTDRSAHRMVPEHHGDPRRALHGAPEAALRLLLAHQPLTVRDVAGLGVHLQLSGHTHAGQFVPFTWLIHLAQPYVAGLHAVVGTWLYVNRGTTYWGPPLRLGAPQEITLLRLVPA